jgi:hypothetical protein
MFVSNPLTMKYGLQLLTLFLLTSLGTMEAQSEKVRLEVFGGAGLGHRILNTDTHESLRTSRNESEIPGISWIGGVTVSKQFTARVWFSIGARIVNTTYSDREQIISGRFCSDPDVNSIAGYTNLGNFAIPGTPFGGVQGNAFTQLPNGEFFIGSNFNQSCNGTFTSTLINVQSFIHNRQLEIPFLLQYENEQRRFRPFFSAGASLNYLLSNRIRDRIDGEFNTPLVEDLSSRKRVGLGLQFSAGLAYDLNARRSVFLQPVLRYTVSTFGIGTIDELSERPASLIFQAGFRQLFE